MDRNEPHCCNNIPKYRRTYSVAGTEKKYLVCGLCANLEYFQKFMIKQDELKVDAKN